MLEEMATFFMVETKVFASQSGIEVEKLMDLAPYFTAESYETFLRKKLEEKKWKIL